MRRGSDIMEHRVSFIRRSTEPSCAVTAPPRQQAGSNVPNANIQNFNASNETLTWASKIIFFQRSPRGEGDWPMSLPICAATKPTPRPRHSFPPLQPPITILHEGALMPLEGIDLLKSKVVPGAFHTADENYDAPKCHPNTRVAILDEIMAWLDDTNDTRRAMWMRGAAGAGKSAIARTIAQMCEKQGRISSTFFFSRTSGDTRRSDQKHLVATLAYQMMEHIPYTRNEISTAMHNNEFIFDLALDVQIDRLIVAPLCHLSELSSAPTLPKIIIINGLDECRSKDAQNAIVNAFVAAIARMNHNFPHKLFIVSRPEQNIQSAFGDRDFAPFLWQLPLDKSWKPDDDIRSFLVDNLAKIRETHLLRNIIPEDWPPIDDIEKLIEKSSGQFIYAATVSKYITSPQLHPVTSLRIIVELVKDPKNRPYAELDALYTHIFASAEDPDLVLQILRIHFMESMAPRVSLPPHEIRFMKEFLGLGEGDIELALSGLSSVIKIKSSPTLTWIKFIHASLPDFLMDESRAGKFYARGFWNQNAGLGVG
ncbi:hypothetical protein BDZ97DRAFT_1983646 [Flammula alnicola]|nr:hypothetical protein BDZ97DRAFT_1983646 [Flammula alnicola]